MVNTKVTIAVRALQAVFTAIVLGTSGYVTNWWLQYWHTMPPTPITFLLFSGSWSLLSLLYLIIAPAKFPRLANPFAMLGVEVLATTFWLAGFVSLAVFLGGRICFGNVCNVARTSTAFAAGGGLLFGVTAVISLLAIMRPKPVAPTTKELEVMDTSNTE